MKIGLAYSAFFHQIKRFYPELEVINPSSVGKYDLVIFSGGEDINPELYGENNEYSSININRDNIEREILQRAVYYNKKILGICRGHQLINACLGGKLSQDMMIKLGINHEYNHKLEFDTETIVTRNFDIVNSLHHQAVIRPGRRLNVTSTYKGIIESTESEDIITVQFHPELMEETKFFSDVKNWVENKKETTKVKKEPTLRYHLSDFSGAVYNIDQNDEPRDVEDNF